MANQPNFLVIMTDQHCFHQLACHGNSVVKTPNIDRLFAKGTSINGMYTATPICMPNRQAFLTMRMNSANGSHSNGVALDLDSNTFPELLRAAGYKTALIGKSHLQNMTQFPAFQKAEETPEHQTPPPPGLENANKSASKYLSEAYKNESPISWQDPNFKPQMPYYGLDEVIFASKHAEVAGYDHERHLDQIDPALIKTSTGRDNSPNAADFNPQTFASALSPEHYPTRFVGNSTISWLNQHKAERPDSPFFLWCSIPDPHHPWTPPQKYYDMYDPEDVVLPDSFYESPRTHTPLLQAVYNNEQRGDRRPRMTFMAEEAEAKRIIATTYGMITFLDEVIGDILETLESNGDMENTVIVFTSDHGDYMGQHGLFLKGTAHYQSLVKVPFIWVDPIPEYNRGAVNALASYVDIGRTILDRANLGTYHGTQGQSFLPFLKGEADQHRSCVLVEAVSFSPQFDLPIWAKVRTLISKNHRLTVYSHTDEGELYDLENDPEEIVNLWDTSPEVKTDLLLQLVQEMADLADTSRLPNFLA